MSVARNRRVSFTLIELLVVIAIISVLAAMLLPALHQARFSAMRSLCLADRKENGLSVLMFTEEHDDLMPAASGVRNYGGYKGLEMSSYMTWHPTARSSSHHALTHSVQTHEDNEDGVVYALGTLAREGYVGDPRQYYCVDFDRPIENRAWTLDRNADSWTYLTRNPLAPNVHHGALANAYRYHLGVSHLWFVRGPGAYFSRADTRLGFIAGNWEEDEGTSATYKWSSGIAPILMACRQSSATSDATRRKYLSTGQGMSHDMLGSNAVFYDGSARWITAVEVQQAGWKTNNHDYDARYLRNVYRGAYLLNDHSQDTVGYVGNFVAWARNLDSLY